MISCLVARRLFDCWSVADTEIGLIGSLFDVVHSKMTLCNDPFLISKNISPKDLGDIIYDCPEMNAIDLDNSFHIELASLKNDAFN